MSLREHILDGLDVETFLVCSDENQARHIILGLLQELGFEDVDVVEIQMGGPGARVRARAYVHRPGVHYSWLQR